MRSTVRVIRRPECLSVPRELLAMLVGITVRTIGHDDGRLREERLFRIGPKADENYIVPIEDALKALKQRDDLTSYRQWREQLGIGRHTHLVIPAIACSIVR